MRNDALIDDLLHTEPVVLRREHPELEDALDRARARGRLARILPGVYADPARAGHPITKMAAVTRWDPDAVVRGRAAAALTFWPKLEVGGTVQVASPRKHSPQPGFEFVRWRVPPTLVCRNGPIQATTPSLTAIDLATFEFTDPIDRVLHSRQATLATLTEALRLTPSRSGNRSRWELLIDSRAEPWSRAEREAHRLYRRNGILGWATNHGVTLPGAGTYYLDLAFLRERIAGEVDGWEHHRDRDVFETDRLRQNALVLNGWLVLRFTWRMLVGDPEYVVRTTQAALAARRRAAN